ncbi:MAG: NTP transferase domain-containing protein [Oscillospiraceae bacterium]|jgi:mannose-1-phosphate guanylyltransferase/phosphomannomutase|nr:NTP transferase domain-containing protein [Oscillospiraceae bacterium]
MKAVIMAGGEGSRLRPLTCDMPKPLARLCGKPVLEYIFELLLEHGVQDAAITLGYLAHMISDQYRSGAYRDLALSFLTEEKPLGTAGGVALAVNSMHWASQDEPFLVISGDAMCDYDLTAARQFHQASGAAVTIVGCEVEDPREYGLLRLDEQNRVRGFIEKPAWGQATSNLANTGIYLIRPDCMDLVPADTPFDFAKDLFPLMLERDLPIYCCRAEGYWCDIGDLGAYTRCQRDLMDGKIRCALPGLSQGGDGVFAKNAVPHGEFQLIPPVYLGDEVEIAAGAAVGPYAVLDDGCLVGEGAKVRSSVLLQNVSVSAQASLTGALLCPGAAVRRGAALFEGSAVGSGAIIGAGACVRPDVAVWPRKIVESNAVLSGNLKYGACTASLFEDGGIGGEEGMLLTPETCAAIGAAIGSIKSCKKAGIACDGSPGAKALMLALTAGLMSAGSHVWSFSECFEAQLSFFTSFCGLGIGVFVCGGREPSIRVCGEGGLTIPRYLERDIEAKLARGEFHRCSGSACKDIADMSSIRMMYSRELMKQAPYELQGMRARIESDNSQLKSLLEDCLERLGCAPDGEPVFRINAAGTQLSAQEGEDRWSGERLLAVCCQQELERGNDLALPFDAPEMLDALAQNAGRKAYRYLSSPADQSDSAARRLSARQAWVRDALFMTVRLLSVMKETECSLSDLCRKLPPFYVEKKSFSLPFSPSLLTKVLGESDAVVDSATEGVILHKENGRLLITPSKSGRRVHVFAEAGDAETARELCDGMEQFFAPEK